MSRYLVEDRQEWRWWVTPRLLSDKPVHRWYVFPHSFTSELVHKLIEEWGLGPKDKILDPFVGAGTTLLAAKEKGVPAVGYDLSPLAVFASRVKLANYSVARLERAWNKLQKGIKPDRWNGAQREYPDLVCRALPGKLLGAFDALDRDIAALEASPAERDFFRLALLSTLPAYSRAVATGGWLSWVDKANRTSSILSRLSMRVQSMLDDIRQADIPRLAICSAKLSDARTLPDQRHTFSAVITSPPYPNRHDYTRVFGVELMFAFMDWDETRKLRYQSFTSHPESHPDRPDTSEYVKPKRLSQIVSAIEDKTDEARIPDMLSGYFLDMYLCLKQMRRVTKPNARIALVLGNAQYYGQSIPVDELTAELGESVGLKCQKLVATRFRGNSAQQMGKYGRKPSRESVVVFTV